MRWAPAIVMALGAILVFGLKGRPDMPLRRPLGEAIPSAIGSFQGSEVELSQDVQRVAGMSDYLLRVYSSTSSTGPAGVSVYIGYYESQLQGQTIHSPKNCLPGSGWEIVTSETASVIAAGNPVKVRRTVIQREAESALVVYWYQGRGRTEASEYRVKWNLLRDAVLRRRSDEALVRIVVPLTAGEEKAFDLATEAAAAIIPALHEALPA